MELKRLLKYFPDALAQALAPFAHAEEIRIRAGRRVRVMTPEEAVLPVVLKREEITALISALSNHSLYAILGELRQGFFTVEGGARIGVAGRTVVENGEIKMIRDFSSANIRLPKEIIGCSAPLLPYLTGEDGAVRHTLIVSPPQQGKTTVLRDLVRAVSDGDGCSAKKCTVVDERGEISGANSFDLGERTDVLLSCPKSAGMSMALRSLSPEVLFTDEIGSARDFDAIYEAVNSGVSVVATAHGQGIEDLRRRLFFEKLLQSGMVERIAVLGHSKGRGTLETVLDQDGKALLPAPVLLKGEAAHD